MSKWIDSNIDCEFDLRTGGTPSKSNLSYHEGGNIPWLVSGDINKLIIKESSKFITKDGLDNSNARFLPKDIVMIALNGQGKTKGTVALLKIEATCNQSLIGIIPKNRDTQHPTFLYYYLKSKYSEIRNLAGGDDRRGLNMGIIRSIPYKYPPILEQKRIVIKLDALFLRIDKSIALLQENIQQTEKLMASVLDEVFNLLKSNSQVVKISDFAVVKGGKRLPKGMKVQGEKTNFPYIRVADFLDSGTIDLNKLQYILEEAHKQIKRYIITPDDLYISIAGTIGKTGIIPIELNGANLTENAARFVYKSDFKINNKFIYYFTLSDSFKAQISEATKTVAQPKLALTRLKEVEIPLPSIELQDKAVLKCNALTENLQEAQNVQYTKLTNLKALKESILDKALKGEL